MNIDFGRVSMLLDIIDKGSKVGMNEMAHIISAAQDELRAIHADLADEKAKSKKALEIKAAEDAAAKAKADQSAPIDGIPRDAQGNIISQPRAVPHTPTTEPDHTPPPPPAHEPVDQPVPTPPADSDPNSSTSTLRRP